MENLSIFKYDSSFSRTVVKFLDLLIMNVLFIIMCIPLFTIGPNITALFKVMFNSVQDKGSNLFSTYITAFKKSFKQSLVFSIFLFLGLSIIIGDLYYFNVILSVNNILINSFFIFLLIVLINISVYAFSQISLFYNKLTMVIKNAFILSVTNIGKTLLITLIFALPIYFVSISQELTSLIITFYLVIGCSLTIYIIAILLNKVYNNFTELKE